MFVEQPGYTGSVRCMERTDTRKIMCTFRLENISAIKGEDGVKSKMFASDPLFKQEDLHKANGYFGKHFKNFPMLKHCHNKTSREPIPMF